ncbi:MAG: quinone-dependent dihydroorotate dehydrogenase [Candidatus Pacebacteria bacterium]|nr:quinone-dependent dihydroorotate dehydrogenase [Candidatus Paceibacterota bacterium]
MYRYVIKPILFLFDPELIHDLFISLGEFLGRFSFTRKITGYIYGNKSHSVVVDGIRYRNPVVLSAGFDYNGRLTEILPYVSFGGVEVGSVTAKSYEGNSKPRLTRLKRSQSILVNKGLKNEGVDAVIKRLGNKERREEDFVIGISVAKTNSKENCDTKEAVSDYIHSLKRLNKENIGDYYAINISCPNAFGGETFTTPELLESLLMEVVKISIEKPVYVKMPINMEWEEFKVLIDIIRKYRLNGVIIGNLNKNYNELVFREEAPDSYRGGLSGLPCKDRSNDLIEKTRKHVGKDFTIIGCGGIFSVEDAKEKLHKGANILQLITGMIYKGPGLIKNISNNV